MPQFDEYQEINTQEYTNFIPIPEYHDYYEEFPTVYWENTDEELAKENDRKRERDSSSESSSGSASASSSAATVIRSAGGRSGASSRTSGRGGRSGGSTSAGSSSSAFASASTASLIAATFVALVAVSAFVIPAVESADLSVDMDVDYGGDTLTYMVSLTNASANARYYVVVLEGATVVYEKEIVDGYQTGIVQGLDGTKDHRVEVRTGLVPLYAVDSAVIPGQDTPFEPVEVNSLSASLNTIEYDVTLKTGSGNVTMGVYPAEGEAAVFTKVLTEGANTGTVTDLLYGHEYVVKFFDENKTYIIKAVTTDKMDSDIVIIGITGLTYTSAEKALVTKTGNNEQTVQYSIDGGANWATTIPEFTDAGEYTVRYKADESDSYKALVEGSVVVTVAKVSYDMTGASWDYTSSFTYDGSEKTVSVTGLPTGVTVSEYSDNSKTNAGDYTASVVTFNYDSINYNEPTMIADCPWTIDKATPVVNVTSAGNTYNGSAQDLVTGSTTGGTLQYKLDDGEYGVNIPQADTVSDHTVYYKVIGSDNYNDVTEASMVVSLAKATYDMTGASWDYVAPFTYDGSEKTVSVTGLPTGVTVNTYSGNTGTNASSDYTASVVTFDYDSINYNEPTIANCPWVISKADASVDPFTPQYSSMYYTGNDKTLLTVDPAIVHGGSMQYYTTTTEVADQDALDAVPEVSWTTSATGNAEGTYYVYYRIANDGSGNYNDLPALVDNKVAVSIVEVTVTATGGREGGGDVVSVSATLNVDDFQGFACSFHDPSDDNLSYFDINQTSTGFNIYYDSWGSSGGNFTVKIWEDSVGGTLLCSATVYITPQG